MLQNLMSGLGAILTLQNGLFMVLGTIIGILAGAIPGLSSTLAISLLVPITFVMDPLPALAMLAGIYNGGMYGGSISSILFNVPGAASATVTAFDGHPMAMNGRSGRALQLAVLASFTGGIISVLALILLSAPLAKVVLAFGPAEYFWVAVFGISIVVSLSSDGMMKGLAAGVFGMVVSMVGMDPATAVTRFDFGNVYMAGGFQLTAILLGMFSIPSAISLLEEKFKGKIDLAEENKTEKVRLFSYWLKYWANYIRSSVIGVIVGIIPAAGGNIASFVAYDTTKKLSKHPETFGKGDPEGVISSEAANNAVTGGSFIPLLTMGIPGSPAAAAIMGAFMVQGIILGPQLFTSNTKLVYGLMWSMLFTNVVMLFAGYYGAKVVRKALGVDKEVLAPLIFAFSIIGCYSIRNSMFDVRVMLIFGVIGFFMKKYGYPSAAFILGYILCPLLEENLQRVIQLTHGKVASGRSGLFGSGLSWLMIALTVLSLIFPYIMAWLGKRKKAKGEQGIPEDD